MGQDILCMQFSWPTYNSAHSLTHSHGRGRDSSSHKFRALKARNKAYKCCSKYRKNSFRYLMACYKLHDCYEIVGPKLVQGVIEDELNPHRLNTLILIRTKLTSIRVTIMVMTETSLHVLLSLVSYSLSYNYQPWYRD